MDNFQRLDHAWPSITLADSRNQAALELDDELSADAGDWVYLMWHPVTGAQGLAIYDGETLALKDFAYVRERSQAKPRTGAHGG